MGPFAVFAKVEYARELAPESQNHTHFGDQRLAKVSEEIMHVDT
jgi:hypothetical protein